MRKQFTAFLAILTLSTALAGCGSKDQAKQPESNETVQIEETASASPEDAQTEETAEETPEASAEAITEKESEEASDDENKASDEAVSHDITAGKDETTAPNKNQNSSSSQSTGSNSVSKPNTTPNTGSSSQNSTAKPQNKPAAPSPSVPPSTTPSAPPSTSPSPSPEAPKVEAPEVTSLSSDEVFAAITKNVELGNQMAVSSEMLKDFYGIDASLLDSFCVKMPQMSFQITEIGVFKVKDANNVSSVVAGINQRANNVGTCLYPSLQETFDSRVVVTKGNYILFAISDDAATIKDAFNSLVK